MTKHSSPDDQTPTDRTLRDVLDGPIDTKLQLIQHHAEMARLLAEEVLEEEVTGLAGKRHSRKEEETACAGGARTPDRSESTG